MTTKINLTKIVFLIILVIVGIIGGGAADEAATQSEFFGSEEDLEGKEVLEHHEFETRHGLNASVTFYEQMIVQLSAHNPTNKTIERPIIYSLRGVNHELKYHEWKPDSSTTIILDYWSFRWPIQDYHNVTVGVSYTTYTYEYNEPFTPDQADETHVSQIDDVEVTERNDSAALNVTVSNSAPRGHLSYLLIHTEGTRYVIARPDVDESELGGELATDTVTVELREDPDEVVRGDVRLFMRNATAYEEGLDAVTFEGTVDGETDVEDIEYVAIDSNSDNRHFEQAREEEQEFETDLTDGDGVTDFGLAVGFVAVGGLVVVLLLVVGVLRRVSS